MEKSILSSVDYVLNLPQGYTIKNAFVRGGQIWGILSSQGSNFDKNRILFYADFHIKPQPSVKIFEDIDSILFIYVSSDGEFCLVRKTDQIFYLSVPDFKIYHITLPPNTKVCAATFFKDDLYPKPFIFLVNDQY